MFMVAHQKKRTLADVLYADIFNQANNMSNTASFVSVNIFYSLFAVTWLRSVMSGI